LLHLVGDLFELNVKLRCQKVKAYINIVIFMTGERVEGHVQNSALELSSLKHSSPIYIFRAD